MYMVNPEVHNVTSMGGTKIYHKIVKVIEVFLLILYDIRSVWTVYSLL